MSRRRLTALAWLTALAAAALLASHLWRQHRLAQLVAAGVAEVPDLRRWPAEFRREVEQGSLAAAGAGADTGPLERLAALYCANGLAPQAGQALAALRRLDPRSARWPYLLADVRLGTGDQDGALPLLRAAVELAPRYAPAWLRLGELEESLGSADGAADCFAKAAAADPASARAEYDRILLQSARGGGAEARRGLEELCRAHPEVREFHDLMAEVLAGARDPDGAARERRTAAGCELNLRTDDPWVDDLSQLCFDSNRLVVGAMRMRREGRFEETERMLRRAVQLAPQAPANPLEWDLLSNFYLKTGRPADARATLEAGVREFPDEPQMHILLARLLCAEHAPQAAVAVARPASKRWPQSAEVQAALGESLHDAGDYAAAEAALREALRLDPTLTEAQYNLGVDLLDLGDRDAARAALEKALVMRPDYPDALYTVGEILLDAGDYSSAQAYVERLGALNPDEPNARHLLAAWHLVKGLAARQAGNLDEAERQFRSGLAAAPDYGALLGEEGSLLVDRGRPDEAVDAFERYIKAEPDNPGGYLSLGLLLQKLGRGPDSKVVLMRGLNAAEKAGDQAQVIEFKRLIGQ